MAAEIIVRSEKLLFLVHKYKFNSFVLVSNPRILE